MASLGAWLVALTVLGAAFVVTHLALLVSTWRTDGVSGRDRWLAVIPPLLPWVAYRAGLRLGASLWAVFLVSYVLLRWLG